MGQENANYVDKTSKNVSNVNVVSSDIMVPVDNQKGLQQTIQTHNAVSVATVTSNDSSYIDTDGFDKIAFTFKNDASTSSQVQLLWSNDGINQHHFEGTALDTTNYKGGVYDTKARYVKVRVYNGDTIAHIMSAWAYLKV